MSIEATSVAGVPAFVAAEEGQARCALVFRVGTSDESLVRSGITHLVEHLTMHAVRRPPHQSNAFVDALRTVFHASGTEEELACFLREICAALQSPPLDRLELERRVLLTEAERRGAAAHEELLTYRFGPRTYGLRAYPEYGLRVLQPDDVSAWTATWFTRDNAALWTTFPVPDDVLRLAAGTRHPPAPPHAVDPLPARVPARLALGLDVVAPRALALTTAWRLLQQRMRDVLRREHAVVYDVGIDTERVGADHRRLVLLTDPLPDVRYRAGQLLARTLEQLAEDGFTPEEVRGVVAAGLRELDEPGSLLAAADAAALDTLVGVPVLTIDELREQHAALTAELVSDTFRNAMGHALVAVPEEVVTMLPLAPVPAWSSRWEPGPTFLPTPSVAQSSTLAASRRLAVGDGGVSLAANDRDVVTVSYPQCEGVLAWEDGSRRLIGSDGFQVAVEPWEWLDGAEATALVDAAAPPELVLSMGPGQGPPDEPQTPAPATNRRREISWGGLLVWAAVSALFASMAFSPVEVRQETGSGASTYVGCGRADAWQVLRHGPGPGTAGIKTTDGELLSSVCRDDAMGFAVGSVLGLISLLACALVVLRKVRARRLRMR